MTSDLGRVSPPSPVVDFKTLFEAIPGLYVAVWPDDPAFTVAAASGSYLAAVKKTRNELIGRGLFDVFPGGPDSAHAATIQNLQDSFRRVASTLRTDTLCAQQYDLPRPDADGESPASQYWDLETSPVLNSQGELQFLLHRVEDVTARVQAEAHLRESEDHYRHSVEFNTQVPWTADAGGRILDFSRKWLELTGLTYEEALGEGWMTAPHPDDRARMVAAWSKSVQTGEIYDIEHRIRQADGRYRWMRSQAFPRRDERGRIMRWYGTTEDIDARKRAEGRDGLLVQLDDAVRPLTDPTEITQAAARLLGDYMGVNRCAYADVEDDEDTFNLAGDYNRGVPSIVGRYTFAQFGLECRRHMREGTAFVIEDSERDPRTEAVRDSYRLTLIRSVICVPLRKRGRFVASMAVHQTTPRRWREDEVELVQLVANRCWESIERARVARELQAREQRYRFLAESIPQMVWTAAPDGNLDYVNQQVAAYFGVAPEAILNEGWLGWVHPEDRERTVAQWQNALRTGSSYEAAFRLLRAEDRSWRWHLVRAHPLIGANGRTVQWFGTCTDFEDQKEAEAGLRTQWRMFDTALSHTPDFAYTFDLEGRFTYVNRALLLLWRKSLEDAVGKNFFELDYPTDLAARLQNQIQQVIETQAPVRDQTPFTGADGGTGHYEYILVPVFSSDGKVHGVAGSTRDVTERERMARELALSRGRLQQVFSQAPVAIVVFRGRDFVVEMANPSYQQFLPGRELTGRKFADIAPDIGKDVWEVFHRVMDTGEPFVGHEWLVSYDQDGDGVVEDHWFNVVYHPLREPDGDVSGMVAVCSDVTAQVRARQELEKANRELEEFAYVSSHDLQEPLRMIGIYSQLLLARFVPDNPVAKEYGGFIQLGVRRMEALIRDLLAYSRVIHTDRAVAEMADLNESLRLAVSTLSGRIEEERATVTGAPLPSVQGDTGQLMHVFQNLLSNSLKYRDPERPPEIHVTAAREGNHWTVCVQDNGIGFEQQYAERIFGLFKRLHKDEYAGTGLGLAICQRIVERYGGRIWAESRLGAGARFYFSLPVVSQ